MQTLINYVIDEEYVNFDKEQIGNLNNLNDRDAIILISNENEKPYVNLDRIVNGYDKYVKINPSDTIFFLEPVQVGMEKKAAKITDEISKKIDAIMNDITRLIPYLFNFSILYLSFFNTYIF